MSIKYKVLVTPFAEKYYIKKFERKYKDRWNLTLTSVMREIEDYEKLSGHTIFSTIAENKKERVCKMEFRIAGKGPSRKDSGNRMILVFNKIDKVAKVLLVYHKQDIPGGGNETSQWKKIVRNNHPEYQDLLK